MKIPHKNANKFAQIYLNFLLLASFMIFFAIDQASALNCYICAEGGLEEFGECKTSFPFNCDGYAKRFSAQDKIFCRTTRHKTFNGSYTVVKECIAESAHFATFPRKSAQLEEECDVLELNGFEVAYCLCRDGDLCNGPSIVEQFTEFENKYPELFDPVPPASNEAAAPSGPSSTDDIDNVGNEEEKEGDQKWLLPSKTLPAAENFNRNLATAADSSSLIRRQMQQQQQEIEERNGEEEVETTPLWTNSLPNSLAPPTLPPNPFMAPPQSTERGEQISRPTGPNSPFGTTDEGEQRHLEEGDENLEPTSPTMPAILATGNGQNGKAEFSPAATNINVGSSAAGTGTQLGLLPELQCLQCSESNLAGSDSDCRTQIVLSCPDRSKQSAGIGRPLCLTRQIQNGPNYSIEKACTTERAILDEFGGKEAADLLNGAIRDESACLELPKLGGPSAIKSAAERLCICSTGQCNRAPIAEQIAYGRMLISQPGPEIHFGAPLPPNGLIMSPSTQKALPSNHNVPSATNDENGAPLNCAICLDVNLRDPKGDCADARGQNCAHLLKDEKAYCLTRQTQNGKDSFIVQKSCVSQHQFYQQFPEELEKHSAKELQMGCASTYDGFVNYCICDGQMCNRNGIAQQAEATTKNPNKLFSTPATNSTTTGIGREWGNELALRNNLATPTNPFGFEASKTIEAKNAAGAGGSWEQNEADNDALFGTAKVTAKRPAPANLSPSSLWTTQTSPTTSRKMPMPSSTPTTTSTSSTTQSTAIRERLEKWKANSQTTTTQPKGDDGGKMLMKEMSNKNGENGYRRKDIFEEYAEAEGNSAGKNVAQIGHMAMLGGLAIWMILAGRIHG